VEVPRLPGAGEEVVGALGGFQAIKMMMMTTMTIRKKEKHGLLVEIEGQTIECMDRRKALSADMPDDL
jgi:hypothetical protein